MSAKLTEKQKERFSKVEAKLPEGYYYTLHDEADAPKYYADRVWGVSVCNDELDGGGAVGHVQNNMHAHTTCAKEHVALVRLLLNRAAAALWHKQPVWEG